MNISMALADGFEEIEAVSVIDILRRAGFNVKTFSISKNAIVKGAHDIEIVSDELFQNLDFQDVDMIILPGGMPGTTNLIENSGLRDVVLDFFNKEKWLAAICAAPTVFASVGITNGKRVTCYPGCEKSIQNAQIVIENVVVDGKIITSRGPGTAMLFGLKIVEILAGKEKSEQLKKDMLI